MRHIIAVLKNNGVSRLDRQRILIKGCMGLRDRYVSGQRGKGKKGETRGQKEFTHEQGTFLTEREGGGNTASSSARWSLFTFRIATKQQESLDLLSFFLYNYRRLIRKQKIWVTRMRTLLSLFFLALCFALPARAEDPRMADRVLGSPSAPVRVDEFVSLTCSHCADFYVQTLPELEKRYVETGKVKFIMHDFPLDGISLKAAAVARCMPTDEYFPFIKTLYQTQMQWAFSKTDPEATLIQYAKLGGLSEEKAKACVKDKDLQNAILTERTTATSKYQVEATPTFVINDGVETLHGAEKAETFARIFDKILAGKK